MVKSVYEGAINEKAWMACNFDYFYDEDCEEPVDGYWLWRFMIDESSQ